MIKVVEIDKAKEIYKQSILKFNSDEIMEKLISDYVPNIDKVSARYKIEQDPLGRSELVSNACLYDIVEYYNSKGSIQKANEIVELNNKYSDVWRYIDEYDEN